MSGPWLLDDMRESGRRQASARAELVSGGRSSGGTTVGLLLGFEGLTVSAGDEVSTVEVRRAHVDIAGEEMWLSANPGGYVIGGTVTVQIDGARKPLYVLGPRSTAPVAGVDVAGAGETVTHLPDLVMDEEARRRNAEVADDLAEAQESWERTVTETIPAVESRVEQVGGLLSQVREQTGRKVWVWTGGEPVEIVEQDSAGNPVGPAFVRAEPQGDGVVRFVALHQGPHAGWSIDAESNLGDGGVYLHQFDVQQDYGATRWVRVTSNGVLYQGQFVVEPIYFGSMVGDLGEWHDMEWPEIDWSDATIGLGQLEDAGLLDPDVWARLFQDVVVAGVVGATEAFIGGNAFIEESVEARHVRASESLSAKIAEFLQVTTGMLNVVTTAPNGARVAITDDGIRMWRAGNSGPNPNVAFTTTDGFRIQDNAGVSLFWLDLATGTVNTNGAVLSNSTISAPTITGGTLTGATLRTAQTGQPALIVSKNTTGWDFLQFAPTGATSEQNAGVLAGYVWDEGRQYEPVLKARGDFNSDSVGRYFRVDGTLTGLPRGLLFSEGAWAIEPGGRGRFADVWTPRIGQTSNDNAAIFFDSTQGGGQVRIPSLLINTTSSASNVYVSGTGVLGMSTSARRYKNDIRPAPSEWAARILDLDPQTWIDAGEAERHKDGDPPLRRVPGLIAEDVRDAGLDTYVTYDDAGEVQGLSYDRLWTLLIPLVREQRDQIATLQQQIDALTERLNRLDPDEGA